MFPFHHIVNIFLLMTIFDKKKDVNKIIILKKIKVLSSKSHE